MPGCSVYRPHAARRRGKPLQTQNLAYSNDRGRTWTKYSGNPVLDLSLSDFRDPHVFWSTVGRRWVMAVALPNEHRILFYGSSDLKRWERLSEFGPAGAVGGQWECPTLTEVPAEGGRTRWVLKVGLNPGGLEGGSGEQYFVGRFDGTRFIDDNPATTTLWTDYGKDCYCALTFNHLPPSEAPVMIGWMNNWQYAGKVPTAPWRGQMTVPRRLQLREGRLVQQPVDAIRNLRQDHFSWSGGSVAALNSALRAQPGRENSFELHSQFPAGAGAETGWKIVGSDGTYATVGYDPGKRQVFVERAQFPARTVAPLPGTGATVSLVILVDRSTIEVFAQDGALTISNLFYPPPGKLGLQFFAASDAPGRIQVARWDMRSTWGPGR